MKTTQTQNQSKSSEKTGKKHDTRWKKGQSGNPNGRPLGSKNFETDFLEAVENLAKEQGMTRVKAMELLLQRAYVEGRKGQFSFYKDIMDRLYGKVADKFIGDKDAPIIIQISNEIAEKNNVSNTSTKSNSKSNK